MTGPSIIRDRPDDSRIVGIVPAGIAVEAQEFGFGPFRCTRLKFSGESVTMTDEAGVVAYGSKKVYTFPTGQTILLAAVLNCTNLTKSGSGINADFDGDVSVGTAAAGNNAALASTEANIIRSVATPQAVAGVTTAKGMSRTAITALTDSSGGTASDTLAAITGSYVEATIENTVASLAAKINAILNVLNGLNVLVLDGTVTPADVYINLLIDDADQDGGGTLKLNDGYLDLFWIHTGDI